jgi:hypothetical protein
VVPHLKRNNTKKLVYSFFIILLILLFLSWLYIFNIYEVGISVNRISSLNYVLHIQPKNSFGFNAPFRTLEYKYEVRSGADNIENIKDCGKGEIIVELKSDSIKVKLDVKTNKTQNLTLVEIPKHKME